MSGAVPGRDRLVEVERDRWDELLERLDIADAYLLAGYLEASAVIEEGRPALLHLAGVGGDVVFACLVRDVPGADGARDVTTPYGYGGPVAAGGDPPVERFHERYEAWAAENGVVTTFVRYHPLFENWRRAAPKAELERLADTVTWPLRPGADLYEGMHAKHRADCRKAERAEVEVSLQVSPALEEFAALYERTMRSREASSFYLFPSAYWSLLGERFGARLLVADARLDGDLVASTLCLATRPWLHYHLAATDDAGRAVGASKLVLLEVARWGQHNGFAELHLGGGLGGREDSIWKFKHRFSSAPSRQFWIGKLVHDAARYRELAGRDDTDGYFPPYRGAPPTGAE